MDKRQMSRQLSSLEKAFPVLILLCMVAGLALGKAAPKVGHILEPLIPLGLFLMIYPTVVKVPFKALSRAMLEMRPLMLSLVLNYLLNPLMLYAFGWLFLRNYPELWTGLILLGIAPCIGMILVWADLGGADSSLSVSLMAWNSLIQTFSVPVWIYLLIGTRIELPVKLILKSTFLYLGLPLVAAYFTQRTVMKTKGEEWFKEKLTPVLGKVQLTALLATLVVMFALKGKAILDSPQLIGHMILPIVLFFGILFVVGTFLACFAMKLPMDKSVSVGFNVTGRNFELSIALALTAFPQLPLVAVSTVIGPLIEVPVMLSLSRFGRRIVESFPSYCVPARDILGG
jgi:ACR3 family arsenite transporter